MHPHADDLKDRILKFGPKLIASGPQKVLPSKEWGENWRQLFSLEELGILLFENRIKLSCLEYYYV